MRDLAGISGLRSVCLAIGICASAYAQPWAYVTSRSTGTIPIVNTVDQSVIESVPNVCGGYGANGPRNVLINPEYTRAFVLCFGAVVQVVQLETNTVVATINLVSATLHSAHGFAITPDGSRLYVAWEYVRLRPLPSRRYAYVSVIDTTTNTVIAQFGDFGPWVYSEEPAITPDGTRCYVQIGSNVSVIDIDPTSSSYNKIIDTLPMAGSPIAITAASDRAYLSNPDGVAVFDIDPRSPTYHMRVSWVPIVASHTAIVFSPDGSLGYAATDDGFLVVIDTDPASETYNLVLIQLAFDTRAEGIAVTPDGSLVYVGLPDANIVKAIDTATLESLADIQITEPGRIAVTPY